MGPPRFFSIAALNFKQDTFTEENQARLRPIAASANAVRYAQLDNDDKTLLVYKEVGADAASQCSAQLEVAYGRLSAKLVGAQHAPYYSLVYNPAKGCIIGICCTALIDFKDIGMLDQAGEFRAHRLTRFPGLGYIMRLNWLLQENDGHCRNIAVHTYSGERVWVSIDPGQKGWGGQIQKILDASAYLRVENSQLAHTAYDYRNFPDVRDFRPRFWLTRETIIASSKNKFSKEIRHGALALSEDNLFKEETYYFDLKFLLAPHEKLLDSFTATFGANYTDIALKERYHLKSIFIAYENLCMQSVELRAWIFKLSHPLYAKLADTLINACVEDFHLSHAQVREAFKKRVAQIRKIEIREIAQRSDPVGFGYPLARQGDNLDETEYLAQGAQGRKALAIESQVLPHKDTLKLTIASLQGLESEFMKPVVLALQVLQLQLEVEIKSLAARYLPDYNSIYQSCAARLCRDSYALLERLMDAEFIRMLQDRSRISNNMLQTISNVMKVLQSDEERIENKLFFLSRLGLEMEIYYLRKTIPINFSEQNPLNDLMVSLQSMQIELGQKYIARVGEASAYYPNRLSTLSDANMAAMHCIRTPSFKTAHQARQMISRLPGRFGKWQALAGTLFLLSTVALVIATIGLLAASSGLALPFILAVAAEIGKVGTSAILITAATSTSVGTCVCYHKSVCRKSARRMRELATNTDDIAQQQSPDPQPNRLEWFTSKSQSVARLLITR